ncbi:hypothetical protein PR003_g11555 [Phytophthora rubi]|uniref:Uncharacterized protein n=1 Tax=Phytophthora rubi TaxID=129364 RepID=A0A6A4FC57_9STRA|nr:hypothetical protein PR003_g11555 [Phytophthora rubi]
MLSNILAFQMNGAVGTANPTCRTDLDRQLVRSAVTNYIEDHRLARRELRQHLTRARGQPDRAEPGVLSISVLGPELELMKASNPTLSTAVLTGQVVLEEALHMTIDFLGGARMKIAESAEELEEIKEAHDAVDSDNVESRTLLEKLPDTDEQAV